MKSFNIHFSKIPFESGDYYIQASPISSDGNIEDYSRQSKCAQKAFLNALMKIVSEDSLFKISAKPAQHIQTIELYDYNSSLVEIANDDWLGIVIQSKDKALLESIFEKLKLMV